MLILSRRAGESIYIDGHVRVVVLEIRGDRVSVGIEAPREIIVDREEIHFRRRGKRRPGP
jgi:carbon storage regulator